VDTEEGEASVIKLRGKKALVTGGAVRLGRAIVLQLAAEGVGVCIHYGSSAGEAEETVKEIRQRGGDAWAIQGDFREPVRCAKEVMENAWNVLGGMDFLINSAAIFEPDKLTTLNEDHFDHHFSINLKAPLFLSQAFVERLGGAAGHIVNIADWRALRPQPGHLVYTMSKAGLVALTKMLALELAPRVQVNAIAPGAILPPPGADANYEQELVSRIPLRRMGSPDDITAAILYLLRSEFVTGEVLTVSGGESL
jgi:pteridine reductase